MNAGTRPHPAAPRIPLVVPILVFGLAVLGATLALLPYFKHLPDHWVARPLGAPVTALLCFAVILASALWFAAGEFRVGRHALLSLALVLLPLAGVLAAAQGLESGDHAWGGLAGRNLAYAFLVVLGTGKTAPILVYGCLLLFGLHFSLRSFMIATKPEDASAVFARLARQRIDGGVGAVVEVPPPSADEALGLPTPVGGELFGADSEVLERPLDESDTGVLTSFISAESPVADPVEEPAALDLPIIEPEPPPPPKRRRVLENIVTEEEFAVEERAVAETTIVPVAAPTASVKIHELFGAGVVDAADDEDVLAPPTAAPVVEEAAAPVAAPAAAPAAETPPLFSAAAFVAPVSEVTAADVVAAADAFGAGVVDQVAQIDVVELRSPPALGDERESIEDAVDVEAEAAAPREVEQPLFVPPPRTIPYEDDEVGDVDDLPTDDEPTDRRSAPEVVAAAAAPVAEPSLEFPDDETKTPPPVVYDEEVVGGRTGEAPRRALVLDEGEAPSVEAEHASAAPPLEAQSGLFADESAAALDEDDAPQKKKRRARAPRAKHVEAEAEASAEAAAEASAPLAVEPLVVAVEAAAETPSAAAEAAPIVEPVAAPPAPTYAARPLPPRTVRPAPAAPSATDDFATLVNRATEVVVNAQRCSPSLLQRELGIRFVEAAAVIERLHAKGVVGPHTPSGVRDVLLRGRSAEA